MFRGEYSFASSYGRDVWFFEKAGVMTKTETISIGIILILAGAIGLFLLKRQKAVEGYSAKQAVKDLLGACAVVTLQYSPSVGASYYVVPIGFIVLGAGFLISTRF